MTTPSALNAGGMDDAGLNTVADPSHPHTTQADPYPARSIPDWSGTALPARRNYAALWLVPMLAFIAMAAFFIWSIPHDAAEHGSNEWFKKGYQLGQSTTLFHGGDVGTFCSGATTGVK
jgi:hypothetical protein